MHCSVVVAACSILGLVLTSNSNAAIFSATITNHSACHSKEWQAETRRLISTEVAASLLVGSTKFNPASSCSAILAAGRPSGDYWILPATGPPAVQIYCDFDRACGQNGTWTRVAFLNMSDTNQVCPGNLRLYRTPVQACGRALGENMCSSVMFSTHGQRYTRVCGRVLGYQNYYTVAFQKLVFQRGTIEENYLAGVSLTHGSMGSRQHIWSFASALGDIMGGHNGGWGISDVSLCSCSNKNLWRLNTKFVGNDYFCDSGNEGQWEDRVYVEDPLWDGAGCGPKSTCCQFNNPPWFHKILQHPTTDDLEFRVCASPYPGLISDTPVYLVELYVQ